jgi:hypothetical protein
MLDPFRTRPVQLLSKPFELQSLKCSGLTFESSGGQKRSFWRSAGTTDCVKTPNFGSFDVVNC